ncbi:archaeosortase/exosortase family protein [Candidatus Woesearchaeota archaeon]|nr:archaeosortase/exosortase family protein [Candidatus Woesearchaeota archaeon]
MGKGRRGRDEHRVTGWIRRHLSENRGLSQFYLKTIVFFGSLFFLSLFIMLYFRHTTFFIKYLKIPVEFYIPWLIGLNKGKLINSFIFILIAFIIFIKDRLKELKTYPFQWRASAALLTASIVFLVGHYYFKFLIKVNLAYYSAIPVTTTFIKYLLEGMFVILLGLAVYGWPFVRDLFGRFWKTMAVFSGIFVVYYFIVEWFQSIWSYLSLFVAKTLAFLLGLSFQDIVLRATYGGSTILGAAGFVVGISKECSGIDSLMLFISLYIFIWVLNWKDLDRKRMAILFVPGVIMTVAYNILRVYLLMLVGILYDPEFAIDTFHTNIGWVLFLLVFFVFWHFGSRWVYITNRKTGEK